MRGNRSLLKSSVLLIGLLTVASCQSGETSSKPKGSKSSQTTTDVNVTVNLNTDGNSQSSGNNSILTDGAETSQVPEADKAPEFPTPPEGSVSKPSDFLKYYVEAWGSEDYKRMYGAIHESTRKEISFRKFTKRYVDDAEFNHGIAELKRQSDFAEGSSTVEGSVELLYQNQKSPSKTVTVKLRKTPEGYRLMDSGIIPLDLSDL